MENAKMTQKQLLEQNLITLQSLKRMAYIVNLNESRNVRKNSSSKNAPSSKALRLGEKEDLLDLVNTYACEEFDRILTKAFTVISARRAKVVKIKDVEFVINSLYPNKSIVADPSSLSILKDMKSIRESHRQGLEFLVSPFTAFKGRAVGQGLAVDPNTEEETLVLKVSKSAILALQHHIEQFVVDLLTGCSLICQETNKNTVYASQLMKVYSIMSMCH